MSNRAFTYNSDFRWKERSAAGLQEQPATLLDFTEWLASERARGGNASVGKRYRAVVRLFLQCIGRPDIALDAVTEKEVQEFIGSFLAQGKAESTLNTNLHTLNTIYQYALEAGTAAGRSPFMGSWESLKRTKKAARPLTLDQLRVLRSLNLSRSARLAFARDLFLVSFYCEGLTFKELSSLERKPGFPGILFYTDSFKGGTKIIEEDGEVARILARYGTGRKAFPMIQNTNSKEGTSEEGRIKAVTKVLRGDLAKLGEVAGFEFKLEISQSKDTVKSLTTRRLLEEAVVGKETSGPSPVPEPEESPISGFSATEMELIESLELERGSDMELARDLFLIAAQMKNVSLFEFAAMEWSTGRHVRTCVRDKKTGRTKYYAVPEKARQLLEKYTDAERERILPLYDEADPRARSIQLRRMGSRLNQALDAVSQSLPLTHRLLLKEVMLHPDGKVPPKWT